MGELLILAVIVLIGWVPALAGAVDAALKSDAAFRASDQKIRPKVLPHGP